MPNQSTDHPDNPYEGCPEPDDHEQLKTTRAIISIITEQFPEPEEIPEDAQETINYIQQQITQLKDDNLRKDELLRTQGKQLADLFEQSKRQQQEIEERKGTLTRIYRQIPSFPNVSNEEEAIDAIKGLIRAEQVTNKIIQANRKELEDWAQVGKLLIRKPETVSLTAKQSATRILEILHASLAATTMASTGPSRFSLLFPESINTADDFWRHLDDQWKRLASNPPQNNKEAQDFINKILFNPPRILPEQPCDHPQQLANALDRHITQDWEDSIDDVRQLKNRMSTLPTPTQTRSSLFKISDVPKFTKRTEYWAYRTALERFFSAISEPDSTEYGMALNRIIASWESEDVRIAAGHWDINPLLRYDLYDPNTDATTTHIRNWNQLKTAFLKACDQKFLTVTFAEDSIKDLNKVRPKPGQTPMDFLLDFETAVENRNSAARLKGIPIATHSEVTGQLLRVIPAYVRDQLRITQGMHLENLTLAQLRQPLITVWTYTPDPRPTFKNNNPRVHNVPTNTGNPGPNNNQRDQVKDRLCGLRCSYDFPNPPVPQDLRGRIYFAEGRDDNNAAEQRNTRCQQADVCESCRRNRAAHRPGQTFRPVLAFRRPRRIMAAPNHTQLEEAPPRAPTPQLL